jgi:hypothetical protein
LEVLAPLLALLLALLEPLQGLSQAPFYNCCFIFATFSSFSGILASASVIL